MCRLPRHFVLSQATLGLLRSLIQSFPPRSSWKPVCRLHEKPQKSIAYHSVKQHGTGKNMTHYSGNIFFEPLLNICAKICILEQIIAIVSFICIQSSMKSERSMLIFQTAPPTSRGWSACTDVKDVKCCLPF